MKYMKESKGNDFLNMYTQLEKSAHFQWNIGARLQWKLINTTRSFAKKIFMSNYKK
jgi:hypothetical protein